MTPFTLILVLLFISLVWALYQRIPMTSTGRTICDCAMAVVIFFVLFVGHVSIAR